MARSNNMALAKKDIRRKMISKMVNRIVEHFDPDKIILFGSHGREARLARTVMSICSW